MHAIRLAHIHKPPQEWAATMRRRALPALATVQGSVAPSPQMAALFMGGMGEDDDGTCVRIM
jgi:hypothetical protein